MSLKRVSTRKRQIRTFEKNRNDENHRADRKISPNELHMYKKGNIRIGTMRMTMHENGIWNRCAIGEVWKSRTLKRGESSRHARPLSDDFPKGPLAGPFLSGRILAQSKSVRFSLFSVKNGNSRPTSFIKFLLWPHARSAPRQKNAKAIYRAQKNKHFYAYLYVYTVASVWNENRRNA